MPRTKPSNGLRDARTTANMTQGALAQRARISRQALSAIEAGRAEPSVSIAMRLARELGLRVEDLFALDQPALVEARLSVAIPRASTGESNVTMAWLDGAWFAHAQPLDTVGRENLPSNGFARASRTRRTQVELRESQEAARDIVVLAGCAPVLGVLAQRLNSRPGPGRFLWIDRSSQAALRAFGQRSVHVAGIHLREQNDDEPNVAAARRRLAASSFKLVTLVEWQAGLVVRPGNPLGLRTIDDLARKHVRIATREPGAGARLLLEQQLTAAGAQTRKVLARALVVCSQLDVGRAVQLGAANTGLAMRASALAYDLDFVPLASERFDLVLPANTDEDPRLVRLLDTLQAPVFRRELACLGGYEAASCGREPALSR